MHEAAVKNLQGVIGREGNRGAFTESRSDSEFFGWNYYARRRLQADWRERASSDDDGTFAVFGERNLEDDTGK